jgi:integrase
MGRRPKDAAAGRGGMDRPRQKNTGGKYQRADGRWGGSFTRHAGDRTWTERTTRPSEEAINEWLRDQAKQEALGRAPVDDRQPLKVFLNTWLEDTVRPTLRESTYTNYKILIEKHVIPELGPVQLGKLSPQQLQRFLNTKLSEGLSPRTVEYLHTLIRRALRLAVEWGMVERNVALVVSPPRVPRHEVKPFTVAEARQFLAAIKGRRLEAVYSVALSLGLRRGEALGLRWQDVDLGRGRLGVRYAVQRTSEGLKLVELKTAESRRTIDMPAITVRALQEHRARQGAEREKAGAAWHDQGLVFCNLSGGPLDPTAVSARFVEICRSAGLPKRRFHDLRHSFVSLLYAQGVPIKAISELVGHSNVRTTLEVYAHIFEGQQKEAMDALGRLLEQ